MIVLESVIFFLVGVLAVRESRLSNSASLAGLLSYFVVSWILLSFAVSIMMFFVKRSPPAQQAEVAPAGESQIKVDIKLPEGVTSSRRKLEGEENHNRA